MLDSTQYAEQGPSRCRSERHRRERRLLVSGMGDSWEEACRRIISIGVRVISLDTRGVAAELPELAYDDPPPAVLAFAHQWTQDNSDPWGVLVASAAVAAPNGLGNNPSGTLHPLKRLISRANHAAVVWDDASGLTSSDRWGYLMQILPARSDIAPGYLRFRLPASQAAVNAAEAVIGMRLPPSYLELMRLTNSLGLDMGEGKVIAGVGPERARWDVVTGGDWLECEYYHEIAARWRAFQGVYTYEHERDRESGANTFLSDERVLVPFMSTYESDEWCFDRSRQRADGECPIVHWDHGLRQASDQYPDFATWMRDKLEAEVFVDSQT